MASWLSQLRYFLLLLFFFRFFFFFFFVFFFSIGLVIFFFFSFIFICLYVSSCFEKIEISSSIIVLFHLFYLFVYISYFR